MKKQISVVTWNNKIALLPKGKTHLQHLVGPYYTARIGHLSLLNLDYCIRFERIYSKSLSDHKKGGVQGIVYNLLKKSYAGNTVRTKIHNMRRGILSVLTRKMSLRILLRRISKEGAINLPPHRYNYRLVAVCLIDPSGEILDIDCRCRDTPSP